MWRLNKCGVWSVECGVILSFALCTLYFALREEVLFLIKLELSEADVNLVLIGLLELPAKNSMDLINSIRSQALPQVEQRAQSDLQQSPQ